jgi:CheY-like chemotaxis protein
MAKRILIADDSVTIQKAFAMTFAAEDVMLLAARSADEGLSLARQSRPELVIADAAMPGRSGYDLCAALKSDPQLRGVPVYILTSSHNPYDELRGRQSGADGNFIKPFDSTALIERVADAIAKGVSGGVGGYPSAGVGGRPSPAVTPVRPVAAAPAVFDDSDYGEITIESTPPRDAQRAPSFSAAPAAAPVRPTSPMPAHAPTQAPGSAGAGGGMRPSLIPGVRPGAVPSARPGGTGPVRPLTGPASVSQAPAPVPATSRPPGPGAPPPAAVSPTRTTMGMGAVGQQPMARTGVTSPPTAPVRPTTQPVRPFAPSPPGVSPAPPAAGTSGPALTPFSSAASSAASSAIDQKVAAIAARGPEYEAIAKLSREIIEKVVWEVVPELAEIIVREELQKRGKI